MCGFMTSSIAFGKLGKFGTIRNCLHPPLSATPPSDIEQITYEVLSGASICSFSLCQILESVIDLGIFSGTLYHEESFMIQICSLQRYKDHEPVEHQRPLGATSKSTRGHRRFGHSCFILGHRSKPLQPVCRELNSDHFAFFKIYSSCSRTHSSSVSNSGTLFILTRLTEQDL